MPKIYRIKLSGEEREQLEVISCDKKAAAFRVTKARALLYCDEGPHGPALTDTEVGSKAHIKIRTLERLRKRCHEVGPQEALERVPRTHQSREPKLDDDARARLVRIACSDPPEGHARWTLSLLADELVTLEIVEGISTETVRQALKKTSSNPG